MKVTKLPPLNSLRAFEAVVRHMSFTKAADELFVTPAALSYQIKQLETFLGVKLFNRLNRAIELTEQGLLIYPGVEQAFSQLTLSMRLLERRSASNVLVVSAAPAFTAKWLAPRLYRFLALHPQIDARISSTLALTNLQVDDVDVAIRFGRGNYPDYCEIKLFDDYVVPMCSPEFLQRRKNFNLESLNNETLIHDDTHTTAKFTIASWQDWYKSVALSYNPLKKSLHFNVADHGLNAAISGAGVVLGRMALAQSDLDAGRLVMPFTHKIKVDFSFYALSLKSRANEPHIKAFRQWLVAEVQGNIDLSAQGPVA
ncbi:MAG: transcriptional regulator GcvA [Oceanospirillaceae bacterium]|nr:transcriptional regulator GcvA [Oceanospirillaceae bacterium]